MARHKEMIRDKGRRRGPEKQRATRGQKGGRWTADRRGERKGEGGRGIEGRGVNGKESRDSSTCGHSIHFTILLQTNAYDFRFLTPYFTRRLPSGKRLDAC